MNGPLIAAIIRNSSQNKFTFNYIRFFGLSGGRRC